MNNLGFIFGSGFLPQILLEQSQKNNICALLGSVPHNIVNAKKYQHFDLGQVGAICKFFKENNIKNVCIAGSLQKPKSFLIKVDLKGFMLVYSLLRLIKKGDNAILNTVEKFLNKQGFNIIAPHDIAPNLFAKHGTLTSKKTTNTNIQDIQIGINALNVLSVLDVGQSCVVSNGNIIAIEGAEGTANMIKRCKDYIKPWQAVLVKSAKIGQNMKLDVPSIGPDTIEQIYESGFAGIAISSVYFISQDESIKKANEYGLFVEGV